MPIVKRDIYLPEDKKSKICAFKKFEGEFCPEAQEKIKNLKLQLSGKTQFHCICGGIPPGIEKLEAKSQKMREALKHISKCKCHNPQICAMKEEYKCIVCIAKQALEDNCSQN